MRSPAAALHGCLRAGLLACALLLPGVPALPAQPERSPTARAQQDVRRRLAALLARLPARTRVGLVVENLADGQRWFAHQPDRPLKPASVQKLFVTAAALERFGPDFRYETRLYAHDGELWVVGAGDPGLGDQRLAERRGEAVLAFFDRWAAALKTRGVRSVNKIVLDDSIFDRVQRHPDWPRAQGRAWYQAPVGGLNINDNCLDARVRIRNGTLALLLQPPVPPSFIRNELTLAERHRPRVDRPPDSDIFEFRGPVARDARFAPISVARPSVFFGHALKQALQRRGVAVGGQVVRRTIAPAALAEARPLASEATALPDVLWRCNAFSQNLFAECLLKSLSAYDAQGKRSGQPGTWEGGAQVLRSILGDLGVDLRGAVFRDGSGLSHQNRATAQQVVRLLSVMWRHRERAVFLHSLAVAGRVGTLRRRLDEPLLRDRVRGKTGTLNGVRALAGYVTRPGGDTLAFALLVNGRAGSDLPRQVCRVLVQAGAAAPAATSSPVSASPAPCGLALSGDNVR